MDKKVHVPFLLIAMLLLAACNGIAVSAKPLSNQENTQQAATATAGLPTSIPTLVPSLAPIVTETPLPLPTQADTPVPTQTDTLVSPPQSAQADNPALSQQPTQTTTQPTNPQICDRVGFMGDITIADGSLINPGDSFTKTWELRNNGSCSWTSGYTLMFVSGDLMGGSTSIPLPAIVNPGDAIDLSVNMVAPSTSGTYQGNWMLRDANGTIFGTGSNYNQPFWVNIVVSSTPSFAVTGVNETVNPASYTGGCPVTIAFDATVTTSDLGTVTYYWQRSDGSKSPVGTLTYTTAGSQVVEDTWAVATPGTSLNGWDQIYIDQPNHQLFDPISFSVICNPPTPTAQPSPTPTPTQVPATLTPTQPSATPIPTATQPPATPTPTQPLATPTPTSTQPPATPTPTQPTATSTPTQPAPTSTVTINPGIPIPTPAPK